MKKKFATLSLTLFFWHIFSAVCYGLTFQGYHDTGSINRYLQAMQKKFPSYASLIYLGPSHAARPIYALSISANQQRPPRLKKNFYIVGAHHGDEPISAEVVLAIIDHLLKFHATDEVQEILSHSRIILQPLVNPDGHARNSRYNHAGFDINRDYRSKQENMRKDFKTIEAYYTDQLMRRFAFVGALSFHAGNRAILWPLGYSKYPTKDHRTFKGLAEKLGQRLAISYQVQSYFDYPTEGEFIDYAYLKYKILAFTLELSQHKRPPLAKLREIMPRVISATLAFIKMLALPAKVGARPIQGLNP